MALALAVIGWSPPATLATAPKPEGCKRIVTTGGSFIGRNCDTGRRVVRVRHQEPPRFSTPQRHERPVDRLRSRGEGRIHAVGDKGARRELRAKANHRHGAGHGKGHGKGGGKGRFKGRAQRAMIDRIRR